MNYRQCTRCVMDTTDTEIVFDDNGYCNHCNNYFENLNNRTYNGKESDKRLLVIAEAIKKSGRNNDYDCIIGVSGGIDSSYAAYILKQLDIRTLCVHMDNGWDSETSVQNIKYIVSKLGHDYQSYVLDWEEFRDLQVSFLKASVPEVETPTDVAIQGVLYGLASKHNIKYIISGGNFATEGIMAKSWHYDVKDEKYLLAIQKKFGTKKLKTFPTFGYYKEIYYKLKGIKTIYLLNHVPYSKKGAIETLERELNWKYYGGKHYESKYTGFIQSYVLYEKFNIDYRLVTFSTLICTGEMKREDALKELSKKPYDPLKIEEEKQYVCKKLGLTEEEFNGIMKQHQKTFRDYPNNKIFLQNIYNIYRLLNQSRYEKGY